MKRILLSLSCGLFLAGAVAQKAEAIVIDIAAVPGAKVQFVGTGNTFSFLNGYSGEGFTITDTDGSDTSVGFLGKITGVFTIGAITTSGPVQTAPVTGAGVLSINDGTVDLTADIDMVSIFSLGATGATNAATVANVSNFVYTGTNVDLLAWVAGIGPSGTITYQFDAPHTLTNLTTDGNLNTTSYSGTLANHVPEGGSSAAILGLGLLGVVGLRRKFKAA